jgi:hypothetical protein
VRRYPYIRHGTIRQVSQVLALVGIAAVILGPAYAINGATRAGAAVRVPVELRQTTSGEDGLVSRLPVTGLPESAWLELPNPDGRVQLSALDSTVVEQLLSRGNAVVIGLALGLVALMLRPLLVALSNGHAFRAGNARRLAQLAVLVGVAGYVAPLLPQVAGIVVLHRLGLDRPESPVEAGLHFSLTPGLVVLLLLLVAEAFRQGERLSGDVEGLV